MNGEAQVKVVRRDWRDSTKFTVSGAEYWLVAIRETSKECLSETKRQQLNWQLMSKLPMTVREVWKNYFDHCRGRQMVIQSSTKQRKYNLFGRDNDPLWTEKRQCPRCKKKLRLGIFLTKHGEQGELCTNSLKNIYVKKKDRPTQEPNQTD